MRSVIIPLCLFIAGPALAGPKCTNEPQSKWIGKHEMVKKIKAAEYKIGVFKVTSGKCYEIYGRDKQGRRVEVYFHPMTGETVRVRKR